MIIDIVAMGTKMPKWVDAPVGEYQKRIALGDKLNIIAIPLMKRNKESAQAKILDKESQLMLNAIPENSHIVALDVNGKSFTTEQLANKMQQYKQSSRNLCLLIGGPEGLSQACLQRANEKWSLSQLTLPHPLVRIVITEALYRAWSVMHGHPYHK